MCIRDRPWTRAGTRRQAGFKSGARTAMHHLFPVSYTHLRAHETKANLVCRLLLEKKRRPPRSTSLYSSAASEVYKRQAVDAGWYEEAGWFQVGGENGHAPPLPEDAELTAEMTSLLVKTNQVVEKVTLDIEKRFHFNTALAAIMELNN